MTIPLPHRARGTGEPPLVLLHGFGADRLTWSPMVGELARLRRTIAFDLPGHGAAADWPETPDARRCASAVAASLDALGVGRAVLVGHSLGGAVAALVALERPTLATRLVLLAPGGFGPEMNVALLARYAAMATEAEAAAVLAEMFGAGGVPAALPRLAVAARGPDPAARAAALAAILGRIARGDGQGTLPLDRLAERPVSLVWGEADAVLPVAQALRAPPTMARHLLPGVGHMPHAEAPEVLVRIVADALAGG